MWGRWPAAGPSEPFGDVETYRRVTESTMAWGGAMDPGMLYLDARLSESYPTVEVRVADVCVEVEDAVLIALLARALVDASATGPAVGWRADLLRVAGWRAARHGIADDLVHPIERVLASPREVFAALLDHLGEHLGDDRARVETSSPSCSPVATGPFASAAGSRRAQTWSRSWTTWPTPPRRPGAESSDHRRAGQGVGCGRQRELEAGALRRRGCR